MAKAKTQVPARRAPSVPKKKYELAIRAGQAARRRARETAQERLGAVIGFGTGVVVGKLEAKQKMLPRLFGVEPTLAYGALLAFGPTAMGMRGKLVQAAAEVGASALGIAGYKLGIGQQMIAGEDDY